MKGLGHVQNAAIGQFDPSRRGMQLALSDKRSLITLWDMATGELLWSRRAPTSLLSRGDWDGDGADEIMSFALGANHPSCRCVRLVWRPQAGCVDRATGLVALLPFHVPAVPFAAAVIPPQSTAYVVAKVKLLSLIQSASQGGRRPGAPVSAPRPQ